MKKLFLALAVFIALFFGAKFYISSNGEGYFKEYLKAVSKVRKGNLKFEIAKYENGFNGAKATIKISISQDMRVLFKEPVTLNMNIEYGPFFWREHRFGFLRIQSIEDIKNWIRASKVKDFKEIVKEPITLHYLAFMSLNHKIYENIAISKILASEDSDTLELSPLTIRGYYDSKTLIGKWDASTKELHYQNQDSSEDIDIKGIKAFALISKIDSSSLVFGGYGLSFDEASIKSLELNTKEPLKIEGGFKFFLEQLDKDSAKLRWSLKVSNSPNAKESLNILPLNIDIETKHLGIKGLRRVVAIAKEYQQIQEDLNRAITNQDDIAMQRAILASEALNSKWIEVYNTLLIKDKTTLQLKSSLGSSGHNWLNLNLIYRGEPIDASGLGAMIYFVNNANRLIDGDFDVSVKKSLLSELYPNAVFIFDSMANKNLATFKDGVYHLKGAIKGGKIIINNTKYNPQELIMMILM